MKWYGVIGYVETVEASPGIWEEKITERYHYGEVSKVSIKNQSTNQVNDNINLSKTITIIADPYANANFHNMRYIEYMGAKWKITNIDPEYPRLTLTIGGLYNG